MAAAGSEGFDKAAGISSDIDAFMTLAFVSLPVIPKLRESIPTVLTWTGRSRFRL